LSARSYAIDIMGIEFKEMNAVDKRSALVKKV